MTEQFSEIIPNRLPLLTPGGSVSVAAAAETAVSLTSANRFGYLLHLEAVNLIPGTTTGNWNLRAALAGTSRLLLQQPIAVSIVGTRYCWSFPFPWKTDAQGDVFTIEPSLATMGTWAFMLNGFHSSI